MTFDVLLSREPSRVEELQELAMARKWDAEIARHEVSGVVAARIASKVLRATRKSQFTLAQAKSLAASVLTQRPNRQWADY